MFGKIIKNIIQYPAYAAFKKLQYTLQKESQCNIFFYRKWQSGRGNWRWTQMQTQGGNIESELYLTKAKIYKNQEHKWKWVQGPKNKVANKTAKQSANKMAKLKSKVEKTEIKVQKHIAEEQEIREETQGLHGKHHTQHQQRTDKECMRKTKTLIRGWGTAE